MRQGGGGATSCARAAVQLVCCYYEECWVGLEGAAGLAVFDRVKGCVQRGQGGGVLGRGGRGSGDGADTKREGGVCGQAVNN